MFPYELGPIWPQKHVSLQIRAYLASKTCFLTKKDKNGPPKPCFLTKQKEPFGLPIHLSLKIRAHLASRNTFLTKKTKIGLHTHVFLQRRANLASETWPLTKKSLFSLRNMFSKMIGLMEPKKHVSLQRRAYFASTKKCFLGTKGQLSLCNIFP